MKTLVTGFPYIRERYFATFRHWPEPDRIRFLLPKAWPAKEGKVIFSPPQDANISRTSTYFSHSHYPAVGGLLKGFMPAFPVHLWRLRHEVELVYACSEPTLLSTLWFAFWSRIFGMRFVCFSWENIPYQQKFGGLSRLVHFAILHVNLFLSNGLVCGNRAGVDIHIKYTSCPIAVIPMNGLDPQQFRRLQSRDTHLSPHIVYTFIGAIGYRKGIHLILLALPHVLKEVPNAHVVIAGNGEYEGEIKRLTHEPFIGEHVTLLPWLDHGEIVRILSESDVFVYPSIPYRGWAEQFGYSMAEASLMELPVISTRSGSIAEVVKDDVTGLLVAPDDADALVSAMVRLGKDSALRVRLGKAGRQFISDSYSHQAVARRFFDFFKSLQ